MDPRTEKAFDFASETTKQLITLATGVLALTITFAKDVIGSVSAVGLWLLGISWGLYIFSLIAGIMTLQCLTGELGRLPAGAAATGSPPSIYTKGVKTVAVSQCALFIAATVLIVVFAIVSLVAPAKNVAGSASCPCLKIKTP